MGCRERAPQQDLVRLTVDPVDVVVVDFRGKLGGRGAWSHPACLSGIEAKPGGLRRAFKRAVQVGPLSEQYGAALQRAIEDGLSQAAAAGALVGGRARLEAALADGDVIEVVVADDASARTVESLERVAPEGVHFTRVGFLTTEQLGARTGRGMRAAVGVKRSRASAHLIRRLQTLRGLG